MRDRAKIIVSIVLTLCLSVSVVSVITSPVPARADAWLDYVNRCLYSMVSFQKADTGLSIKDRKAWAYLVGTDDMADKSWLVGYDVHDLYAVDPDTKINGKSINSKYLPQDNKEYLISIREKYLSGDPEKTEAIYSKPKGFQGTHREGAKFMVFDYNEEWVTVWDDGFQLWDAEAGAIYCKYGSDAYLETHPAGFYKIKRNEVWLDFNLPENHPYSSEKDIPKVGTGIVTKLVNLRPVPNEKEKVYTPVYALPMGTKLTVVSTKLVPSKARESKHMYYKVMFNGSDKVQNNAVHYLDYTVPGVYYLDSRYLNFTKKGTKAPKGTVPGEITNVKKKDSVYAYSSKDINSERIGILSKGVEIEMLPSESDQNWTAVYFSGQMRYVQTKYIKRAAYKVTDISSLGIADIVDDEIVVSWNKGKNNVDFICTIQSAGSTKKKKIYWSDNHYTKNSFTIKRAYMKNITAIDVTVQAADKNGRKGKKLSRRIFLPLTSKITGYKNKLHIGKNKITGKRRSTSLGSSVQYAANKKFKGAKTLEKYYNKNGRSGYEQIKLIKKLKPKTTYYIRWRTKKIYNTKAGKKWLSGNWSKAVKVKTKR